MFNVIKSPAPAGEFKYTDFNIADQVKGDFHYKCYLCEESAPRHLEIDHFFPASVFADLIHDWQNLFSGCSKCNKIKAAAFNTELDKEILNCCAADVESAIVLRHNITDSSITITGYKDVKTINTIDLLNRIYNGVGTSSRSYYYLQEAVTKALSTLRKEIDDYYDYPSEENKQRISVLLSKKSVFTAIKRTLILDYNPEFKELFD